MLFNSAQFAIFFAVTFAIYFLLRNKHRWQNKILLVASYIFYGAWDWRFLSLLFISTYLDYYCGLKISETEDPKRKKRFLLFSIFGNLAMLGFFKYYNFFIENFQHLLSRIGLSIHPPILYIILPVGISFYTFQTMSYTIDVYHGELVPTKDFLSFALFVSFFPQLVAGPIERAKNLLPQVLSPRRLNLNQLGEGCHLIFWGLFQKIFIADNLAKIVDPVFAKSPPYSGVNVLIGLYAFAFQILCDFEGYSNIARGLGKCMGFEIMINFNLPYFSTNPREFWKRWHISLSSWLRDYLYIPLGGNKKGEGRTLFNITITMLLGGLWHGAAWTFIIWGMYQAVLLVIHRVFSPYLNKGSNIKNTFLDKIWNIIKVIFFFHLICLGWLIFRAQSIKQAVCMLEGIFFNFYLPLPNLHYYFLYMSFILMPLLVMQILQAKKQSLTVLPSASLKSKFWIYLIMFYLILIWGDFNSKEFIYFQF